MLRLREKRDRILFLKGQLDKILDTTNFTAVFWYARNCKRSENILIGRRSK